MEEDEEEIELNINIEPKEEILKPLGVTQEEFKMALSNALDAAAAQSIEEVLPIEETLIILKGKQYQLEEVANIEIPEIPEELVDSDEE